MIVVTEQAAYQIQEMIKEAGEGEQYVRLAVNGGGCSGLSYGLGFEKDANEQDEILEFHGVKFLIDKQDAPILQGVKKSIISNLCLAVDLRLIIQMLSQHAAAVPRSVQRQMQERQSSVSTAKLNKSPAVIQFFSAEQSMHRGQGILLRLQRGSQS
ncbi:hypothetical protein GCM10020331_029120 [Ectobacillus funiculus]